MPAKSKTKSSAAMEIKTLVPFAVPSIKAINKHPKRYKSMSFFAGCGGSSTGLKMAGFDVIYANEFVDIAAETYEANACKHTKVDCSDIRQLNFKKLRTELGLKRGELDHMDGSPPCFVAGTLVRTKEGFKPIEAIKSGDSVLTHRNRFRTVKDRTVRKYKGKMVTVNAMNSELITCTPEHPFYILRNGERHWCHAKDLLPTDYVAIPYDAEHKGTLPDWDGVLIGQGYNRTTYQFKYFDKVSYLNQFFDSTDFWEFVGRFLGDGWCKNTRRPGTERRTLGSRRTAVYLCCGHHEFGDIIDLLNRCGFHYTYSKRRTAYRFKVKHVDVYGASAEFVDFMLQFGDKAHGKFIPGFVYDLPKYHIKALIKGYLKADGHSKLTKYNKKVFGYSSVSRKLTYGITSLINSVHKRVTNKIAARAGRTSSIEGRTVNCRVSYGTRVSASTNTKKLSMFDGEYMWARVRTIYSVDFNGDVYNMHVEEDESYTANLLAVHNCSSFSTAGTREEGWGVEKQYSEGKIQRTDDLFFEYVRALKEFQPKTFDAENVSGLVKGNAKGYFIQIFKALEECGYVVKAQLLDASWLGVPQARQRLIFVGVRKDLAKKYGVEPKFPAPLDRQPTVRECFPYIMRVKTKVKGAIRYVDANRPNSTITASDSLTSPTAKFSDGGFIQTFDGDKRKYNIEELKVICGFPEDFKLIGKYEQQFERLGRSHVPVQMYWIGKTIADEILDKIKE